MHTRNMQYNQQNTYMSQGVENNITCNDRTWKKSKSQSSLEWSRVVFFYDQILFSNGMTNTATWSKNNEWISWAIVIGRRQALHSTHSGMPIVESSHLNYNVRNQGSVILCQHLPCAHIFGHPEGMDSLNPTSTQIQECSPCLSKMV